MEDEDDEREDGGVRSPAPLSQSIASMTHSVGAGDDSEREEDGGDEDDRDEFEDGEHGEDGESTSLRVIVGS